MHLRIHARSSDLARIQAYSVGEALKKKWPTIEVTYGFRESLGDKNLHDPLWKQPQKGIFTEDFHDDLIHHHCDVVVHSWKDLPIETRLGTKIIATLPRADMRDLILIKKESLPSKNGELHFLSSSPRRIYNLSSFLSWALPAPLNSIKFHDVRGNIPTRIKKLLSSNADGLIVAKAAIDRILETNSLEFELLRNELRTTLHQFHWMIVPIKVNPTAPAQGALAIEVSNDNLDLWKWFEPIHSVETEKAVLKERQILAKYGGGCHQKIGVTLLNREYGEILSLKGMSDEGLLLDEFTLFQKSSPPPKTTRSFIWPENENNEGWFDRRPLTFNFDEFSNQALWVSREDALPHKPNNSIVWCAGLATWKKLVQKGIWVHGCSEGLGEREFAQIDTLIGQKVKWTKLTHNSSPLFSEMDQKITYQLIPKENPPELQGKTHYYWTSGSSFLRALELYPHIKKGWHGCGPGNSYEQIIKHIDSNRLRIYLSHRDWLKEVLT